MILEKKVNKQTFNINNAFLSQFLFLDPFLKIPNLKIAKFSTPKICETYRFTKFNTLRKIFKKEIAKSNTREI